VDAISVSLVMLIAVMASSMIGRALPVPVPLPLVQIALGALIASVLDRGVELDPELFFFLFLPPLLFLDGWRIPKEGLVRDRAMILQLALGLVVVTVVGLGYLIHLMIPSMPLAICFALAAIISPTDPVAVSAITQRLTLPHRIMHILEGESLLNDASGLVAFRFAVAAAVTGTFSLTDASLSFLWVSLGGLGIGAGITWLITFGKGVFARRYGEDGGSQILISVLIPFAAYALAEHLGASGILAAVAAGITMSYTELSGRALASTRMQRAAVWNTIQFTLNGIIFVLLGEQLPAIFDNAVRVVQSTGHRNPLWLFVYALAINLTLAGLRFGWVWASLKISNLWARWRGETPTLLNPRLIGVISLAGTRGALTLAGVLTLPLALNDGTPLPARDLAIFLAATVIIISLLASSFGLPRMIKGIDSPVDKEHHRQEDEANEAARLAAIKSVEATLHQLTRQHPEQDAQLYTEVAGRVMDSLQYPVAAAANEVDAERVREQQAVERQMRLAALGASRDELFRLARQRRISDEIVRELVRRIDLQEARLL